MDVQFCFCVRLAGMTRTLFGHSTTAIGTPLSRGLFVMCVCGVLLRLWVGVCSRFVCAHIACSVSQISGGARFETHRPVMFYFLALSRSLFHGRMRHYTTTRNHTIYTNVLIVTQNALVELHFTRPFAPSEFDHLCGVGNFYSAQGE